MKSDNKTSSVLQEATPFAIPGVGILHFIINRDIESIANTYKGVRIDKSDPLVPDKILGRWKFEEGVNTIFMMMYFPFFAVLIAREDSFFESLKDRVRYNFLSTDPVSVFFYLHLVDEYVEKIIKDGAILLKEYFGFNRDVYLLPGGTIYEKVVSNCEGMLFPSRELYEVYVEWIKEISSDFEEG